MSNITNLNRDYLIKINVKEATIDVPKMTFWNTDKKTSNMFVQLVINMSTNELISQYVTVQNATDYKITLNVIKPKTNQYRTIEATLLNEEKALFEIDLPDEFTDQVGDYSFEFEVSSKVDSNDESITTSNGIYKVNGSILTNLNEETSSSPDLPILKQLIEQVKSLQGGDLTGYQKKEDETLETTSKKVVGAINEVNSQYKDITNKLEILPIKNTHHVIQDGVPASQQNISINGIAYEAYIFNDEQITTPSNLALENFKNKFLAIYYDSNKLVNAIVTYNDGTNNITKEVELTGNDYSSPKTLSYTEEGTSKSFTIEFGFDNNTNEFYIYVDDYSYDDGSDTFYEVKNVSLSYLQITNLLDDDYLKSIDYSKIKNIPSKLNALVNGSIKTLDTGEYASLFDNLFIWDANKMNERLDDTSGVKQNQYYNHTIKVKQKDSEGIGYGQYIPSSVMTGYKLFVSAGSDVIIKVYNRKTKELIAELSDFPGDGYTEIGINDSYSGTDGIFIAFTVKDSVKNFYGNTYVNNLILCKSSGFLTKQEVNNKVDKSQLSFNSNGELVVTIDGISKTFVPKA